jgi:hypothetical protein
MHDIANTRLQASVHSIALKSTNGLNASVKIVQRGLVALGKTDWGKNWGSVVPQLLCASGETTAPG